MNHPFHVCSRYLNDAANDEAPSTSSTAGGEGSSDGGIKRRPKTTFTSGRATIPKIDRKKMLKEDKNSLERIRNVRAE